MRVQFISIILVICFLVSCKQGGKKPINSEAEIVATANTEISEYVDLKGDPVSITDFKGKRILLNFWATWCRPCIEEMPALERAKSLLEKENYSVLLASDQSLKEIKVFKTQNNFSFKFIKYTGVLSKLSIYALPTTFVFNEKGEKIGQIVGATEWDSPEMLQKLKNY